MPTSVTLIDLDDAAPLDRHVKLAGKTWRVPGDAPTGWLLQFRQLERGDLDELELVERMRDLLVDLFLIRQPDAEEELAAAIDERGAASLLPMVGRIYGSPQAEIAAQEETAPERPSRAGTRSTRQTPRSRSRSSASSAS